jgi:hypothetical protein
MVSPPVVARASVTGPKRRRNRGGPSTSRYRWRASPGKVVSGWKPRSTIVEYSVLLLCWKHRFRGTWLCEHTISKDMSLWCSLLHKPEAFGTQFMPWSVLPKIEPLSSPAKPCNSLADTSRRKGWNICWLGKSWGSAPSVEVAVETALCLSADKASPCCWLVVGVSRGR